MRLWPSSLITACALACSCVAGSSVALATSPEVTATEPTSTFDTIDRLIVTTTSASVSDSEISRVTDDAAMAIGLETEAQGLQGITRTVSVVQLDAPLTLREAEILAAHVEEAATVTRASPDYRVQPAFVTPDDPLFPDLWGIWNTDSPEGGFSARAPQAWPATTGAGVVVAVLDTGITAHPDLDAQVLPGYDFVSDVFTANDLNGRDDSPADPGDWITSSESTNWPFAGCRVSDSSWHGTHVAGTIAAIRNNATGVVGVAPGARILPVRVLGKCGGSSADIIAAIEWASGGAVTGVPANQNPADVINMSLGGGID